MTSGFRAPSPAFAASKTPSAMSGEHGYGEANEPEDTHTPHDFSLIGQFRAFYAEVQALTQHAQCCETGQPFAPTLPSSPSLRSEASTAPTAGGAAGGNSTPSPGGGSTIPPVLAARLAQDAAGGASPIPPDERIPLSPSPLQTDEPLGGPAIHRRDWAATVEPMIAHLAEILERGSDQAIRHGGAYGGSLYEDAKYAMAALADEVFLHQVDWDGAEAWGNILLEHRLFTSALAGERLFQRIDATLKNPTSTHAELAAVYLLVLTLGFQGQYRGRQPQVLDQYRQRLRAFLTSSSPASSVEDSARAANTPLFPAAYAVTLDEGHETMLPSMTRWLWWGLAAVALYLAVSHGLWVWMTAPIRDILQSGGM